MMRSEVVLSMTFILAVVVESQLLAPVPCGKRPPLPRVVAGDNALPHSWPWQAEIQIYDNGSFKHRCGASLINLQWIVTAAHCLFMTPYPQMYKIVLGEHDRFKKEGTEQEFSVAQLYVHPRFLTDKGYGYDIAVMKLSRPALLNKNVGTVCLPQQNQTVPPGKLCYITGWGKTSFTAPKANILQQAQLPVVSYDACVKGNSHLQAVDDRSMLCAGYDGANASPVSGCNGDSGGPFVCQDQNSNWVLQGAVSWGDYKCRGSPTYSVFTRVSSFVDWIQEHVTKQQGKAEGDICEDKHPWCSQWKKEGKCLSLYYKNSLKEYCPLTCGYCIQA